MAYQLRIKPNAKKELAKLPKQDRQRIVAAFCSLSQNPFIGKKLKGELEGRYSFRVWPYRIVYQIYKSELLIIVIKIGHRQEVY